MRNVLISTLFLTGYCVCAQKSPPDLSSPYHAVHTHLYYLQSDTYNDSIAALPFRPEERGMDMAKSTAIKWKRILDGRGIYIYMDEVPRQPNYYDSTAFLHKYIPVKEFPNIYLTKQIDGNWRFTDAGVNAIEALYDDTFRFGAGRLITLLPHLGSEKILGLYLYQYLTMLFLALTSVLLFKFFTIISEKLIKKSFFIFGRRGISDKHLKPIAKPVSVFIIVFLLIVFTPALQLPPDYSRYVVVVLKVMLPFFGTVIVYRLVNILAMYLAKRAHKTESTLDDQLVPLLRKMLKTFVVIIGTLFILDNLNVPILPLLMSLSIGGLAFALAAQDTIKNFFGSVMIFIDKPFQVGDWITTSDIDGTVEEVGFRSSRIRTFSNSLVYVPNGKLADSTIDNHGLRKYRRFYTQITVTYDTPPRLLETFVKGLRTLVEDHPDTWKENYHVYFNEMGASSLNIMFYIFFKLPTWGEELRARHEILIRITELAKELGIEFAFPTQTLHVETLPDRSGLSSEYPDDTKAENKTKDFFKK